MHGYMAMQEVVRGPQVKCLECGTLVVMTKMREHMEKDCSPRMSDLEEVRRFSCYNLMILCKHQAL